MNSSNADPANTSPLEISLVLPNSSMGWQVNQLIQQCPPLDTNSTYCNILQCDHFANTSVAAFLEQKMVGFISGYIQPEQPDTLFIWQVAVHEKARGQRLAKNMLLHILQRQQCKAVRFLETTITKSNQASWALFQSLARMLEAETSRRVYYHQDTHFQQQSPSEWLMRIGPFKQSHTS